MKELNVFNQIRMKEKTSRAALLCDRLTGTDAIFEVFLCEYWPAWKMKSHIVVYVK